MMLKKLLNLRLTDKQLLELLLEYYVQDSKQLYLCVAARRIPNSWELQRLRVQQLILSHIDGSFSTLAHSAFARSNPGLGFRELRIKFLETLIEGLK